MTQRSFSLVFIILAILLFQPRLSQATLEETLPTYHWSYPLLDQLRLRGYFTDLFISNRPFTRGEIARSLQAIQAQIETGRRQPSRSETWLLNQLNEEFKDEFDVLSGTTSPNHIKLGFFDNLDLLYRSKDLEQPNLVHYGVLNGGTRIREGFRSKISVGFGENLTLYHSIRLDRQFKDDPTYIGKFFRGFAGFTEQAYVQGRYGRVHFKVGRDNLVLGSGKRAQLLLSDNTRTFDQYSVDFTANFIKFTAFGIQLDDIALDSLIARGQGPVNTAKRYINGHRLDVRLGSWANVGISELVLYGGQNRNFELAYLNPINFYHGVTLNDEEALGRPANTLGAIDFNVFPAQNVEVFGELLIDDVKIEKANASDLEPNKLGYLFGLQYANPLGLDGVQVRTEYTRITNRTYNILFNDWERFLHRNRPIGHFLGNNFDRFEIGGSGWGARQVYVDANYEFTRQGQDNIASAYNTDYLNFSPAQGYSEPFPFGPVQRTHALNLTVQFIPLIDIRCLMTLRLAHVRNFAFTGQDRNQVQLFQLGVIVNYDRILGW